jgi:hypothetical protein
VVVSELVAVDGHDSRGVDVAVTTDDLDAYGSQAICGLGVVEVFGALVA